MALLAHVVAVLSLIIPGSLTLVPISSFLHLSLILRSFSTTRLPPILGSTLIQRQLYDGYNHTTKHYPKHSLSMHDLTHSFASLHVQNPASWHFDFGTLLA